jgi:hypothetical protein
MRKLPGILLLLGALLLLTGSDYLPLSKHRTVELKSDQQPPGILPVLTPQEQLELKYDDGSLGGAFLYEKGNWYGVYFMPDSSDFPFRLDFLGLAFYDLEGKYPSREFRLHILDDTGEPLCEMPCTIPDGPDSYFPNWSIVQLWQKDIVIADSFLVMIEYLGDLEPALCFDSSLNGMNSQPHSLMRDMNDDTWWWISYDGGLPDLIIRTVVTPNVETPVERRSWGSLKRLYINGPPDTPRP